MDSEIETHIDEAQYERSYQTILRDVDEAANTMPRRGAAVFLDKLIEALESRMNEISGEIMESEQDDEAVAEEREPEPPIDPKEA